MLGPMQGHLDCRDSLSGSHPGHRSHCPSVYVPGYSMLLLRVQQLIKGMNSLTCKMNALKNNGEGYVGVSLLPFPAQDPVGSIEDPLPPLAP